MAKGWKATTTIKAGKAGTFMDGDIVTGLDASQMAQLWEAGALEEAVVTDSSSSDPAEPPKISTTEGNGQGGNAKEGDASTN
jgi:hypothetical protein